MKPQTWRMPFTPQKEINTGKSETQPDMTMSLAELLRRHAKGLEVPVFEGQYDDENGFMPDPRTLDMADLHDMAEDNASRIIKMQESLAKAESGAKPAGRKRAVAETESEVESAHSHEAQRNEQADRERKQSTNLT